MMIAPFAYYRFIDFPIIHLETEKRTITARESKIIIASDIIFLLRPLPVAPTVRRGQWGGLKFGFGGLPRPLIVVLPLAG